MRGSDPFSVWSVVPRARRVSAGAQQYAVTLANAEVSGDTTVASAVIPAGQWVDGWIVGMRIMALRKNDSGSARTTLLKVGATGAAATQLASVSWDVSATERKGGAVLNFCRSGSLIYVPAAWAAAEQAAAELIKNTTSDGFGGASTLVELTPTSFTADITLTVVVNLAVTNAAYYFRPRAGWAWLSPQLTV